MSRLPLALALTAAPILVPPILVTPAAASPIAEIICAPSDEMTRRLLTQFGETRMATGVRGPDQVLEVWTGEDGRSWTLVATYAGGTSCIVAMGEHWQTEAAAPA